MTDDSSTTERAESGLPLLDGSTAEWNVAEVLRVDGDEDTASPRRATAMPLPPSKRGLAPTAFKGGAVAPGGATATLKPLVTVPKQRRQIEVDNQPSVLVAHDPNATLPPRDARQAPRPSRARLARPSFVAIGAAMGCTFGYAVWAAQRPSVADAAPGRELPQFLLEASAAAGAPAADSPAPQAPLPPELAATPIPSGSALDTDDSASADAGVSAGPTALEEETRSPPSSPLAADTHARADALRAALNAQRSARVRVTPEAKPDARTAFVDDPKAPTRRPSAGKLSPKPSDTRETAAVAKPSGSATIRPLTTYAYADQALFPVATAPKRVTDLVLERGETLAAQPTAGDAARWVVNVVQGADRTHVFVTPLRPGLRTNLTLATNRRTYFLELSSRDDGAYMAGVQWTYPGDDAERRREALARAERERQTLTAVSDLQALRFDYAIRATEGAREWKPTMVFHDGKRTFIRFPKPIDPARAPILLIPRTGNARNAAYINYRVKGDIYVVDRLIDAAELRLPGEQGQDIVRITRKQ